jgi:hypothetical protein
MHERRRALRKAKCCDSNLKSGAADCSPRSPRFEVRGNRVRAPSDRTSVLRYGHNIQQQMRHRPVDPVSQAAVTT